MMNVREENAMENLLNAVDVAQRVGCSPQTLSVYYNVASEATT